jgi:XTP/dITP diphosphohydrolase
MTERAASTIVVLASANPGKLRELQQLLGLGVSVVSATELGVTLPEETEITFAGNAALKSHAAFEQTGHISLADDSGIEVDALDGRPGVYSARFAGESASDAENNHKLLQEMEGVPEGLRTARFRSVIAISLTETDTLLFDGACEGTVGLEEIGTNGFGYDPLFRLPSGQPFALLSSEEKNAISHRGGAMRKAIPVLLNHIIEKEGQR